MTRLLQAWRLWREKELQLTLLGAWVYAGHPEATKMLRIGFRNMNEGSKFVAATAFMASEAALNRKKKT